MQGLPGRIALAFIAGAAVAFAVLRFTPGFNRPEAWVLRAYEVPLNLQQELRDSLSQAVAMAQFSIAPNGQLLVNAPRSTQKDLPDLIHNIINAPAAEPVMIRLDIWFVAGGAAAGKPLEELGSAPVAEALRPVAGDAGAQKFTLRGQSSMRLASGATARVENAQAKAQLRKRSDGSSMIMLELRLAGVPSQDGHSHGGDVSTQIVIAPGETVVVGQQTGRDGAETYYHIVRAAL